MLMSVVYIILFKFKKLQQMASFLGPPCTALPRHCIGNKLMHHLFSYDQYVAVLSGKTEF